MESKNQQAIEKEQAAISDAVARVYSKYGSDLKRFFNDVHAELSLRAGVVVQQAS